MRNDPWQLITLAMAAFFAVIAYLNFGHWIAGAITFAVATPVFAWFFLHDEVRVGDVLELSAPAGDFVLERADGPLLLASAGAGITTVLPIVEHRGL